MWAVGWALCGSGLFLTDSVEENDEFGHLMSRPLSQVSSKDEDFLDLSVDVEQNTSITHCLRYYQFILHSVTAKKAHGRMYLV